LASGVAHDFNNIVSVIKGYAQLASRKCAPDDTLKKYVAMICKLCGRAEHVVEQIFSFARREEQPLRPVRLQRFIDEAAGLLRSTSPSNIRIRLEVDSMCSPIKGDSTRLQQLLLNLCTNAMHAMEEKGGQLLLRLSQISLTDLEKTHPSHASSLEPGDYVVLGVEDSGTGIEPKLIDRIFEPYFTTKEKGKGTGLGLAVAQSIVQSHRGAVFVDSSPGKGTEFSIYFPVAAGDETSVEPAAGDQPQI
jgi:signal transduction histidine kinase